MERGEETLSENKDHSTRTISVVMAITLLGKRVVEQGYLEKYLDTALVDDKNLY